MVSPSFPPQDMGKEGSGKEAVVGGPCQPEPWTKWCQVLQALETKQAATLLASAQKTVGFFRSAVPMEGRAGQGRMKGSLFLAGITPLVYLRGLTTPR